MNPGMLESAMYSDTQIEVCDPIEKEGLKKYIVYCIKGMDSRGAFEVYRRYSDFFSLRKEMLRRWPGIYIPEIPPKKAVGNMNKDFVEKRKQQLSRFVVCISNQENIYYSEEFQLFHLGGTEGNDRVVVVGGIVNNQTIGTTFLATST